MRATSRWLVKRTLPCLVKRMRTRAADPGWGLRRLGHGLDPGGGVGVGHDDVPASGRGAQRDGHRARQCRSTGPARCPGCRRPAGWPRPPRARCRSRCRRRSRSRASSGSRAGPPRRGRPASPARGSPCAGRRRCGPTAGPRPRCGAGRRTTRRRGRGRPWPRATGRGGSARSTPGTCRPGATPARSPGRAGGRRARRAPRPALALGSCQVSCTPLALRPASRSSEILRCSSSAVFWPNHWNGVNGLGTKPPTDALTDAPLVWLRPISTQLRARSRMPSVSSSVSEGRPVRK